MQKSTTAAVNQDLLETYFKLATVTLIALAVYMAFAAAAMATSSNSPMGTVLCNVASMITSGNLGRGVATLGIVVLGVGASIGKVSWGLAMTVGVGIAVAIRAPQVVDSLLGAGSSCP